MIKLDNSTMTERCLTNQKAIGGESDYLEDILRPALLRGDWEELDSMIIYEDSRTKILFGYDRWSFKDSEIEGPNFNFNLEQNHNKPTNVTSFLDNRTIVNQIKCLVIARMYFTQEHVKLKSIRNLVWPLIKHAKSLQWNNIHSFEEITKETLINLIDYGFDLSGKLDLSALNSLFYAQELLPFDINYENLTTKSLFLDEVGHQQHCVIPPRIYFTLLNDFSKEIEEVYKYKDHINKAVSEMLNFEQDALKLVIGNIRNGQALNVHKNIKSNKKFFDALVERGIEIADKEKDKRWMYIYNNVQPPLVINSCYTDRFEVKIGDKKYNWAGFRQYMKDLHAKACWLCLALTGMRRDELYRMHPDFGAQKVTLLVNSDSFQNKLIKETIYFLTTRQSKITPNSQTTDDDFITTIVGYKAYYILNAIHSPLRKFFPEEKSHRFFSQLHSTRFPRPYNVESLGCSISQFMKNRSGIDLILTDEDIKFLNTSEQGKEKYQVGDLFNLTNHQPRRSLAYYLIGYELCSFPALKQQLGHFTMAMTRWYARNANSFQKFWNEIKDERITQQADILVRIFTQMANGERVAGGKGKTYLREIAKQGENYFKDSVNKRYLSRQYWIDKLRSGAEHLHAIAPGMYCSNDNCSMRLNIDLTECVECEWDYIENVIYAEGSRMDAMRNLNFMIEYNELNSSSATKYYMQIKAAEKIMSDLDFDYSPYEFQSEVINMIIHVRNNI
ncbi:integrase [Vibrio parahaemolyticus]|uniref:integrase n=2 Tax=Vibrio parahaemolyticus TaxID=670 RepID=UPI00236175BF|nr:integrase [Vibrio parahaemolyticus]